jgi:hypothetical protein
MGATEALEVLASVLLTAASYLATDKPWVPMLIAAVALVWFAHGWDWSSDEEPEQILPTSAVKLKGGGFALVPDPSKGNLPDKPKQDK